MYREDEAFFDENDIQDIDDLMDFYRLEKSDLLQLDEDTDEQKEEDFSSDYYEDL